MLCISCSHCSAYVGQQLVLLFYVVQVQQLLLFYVRQQVLLFYVGQKLVLFYVVQVQQLLLFYVGQQVLLLFYVGQQVALLLVRLWQCLNMSPLSQKFLTLSSCGTFPPQYRLLQSVPTTQHVGRKTFVWQIYPI